MKKIIYISILLLGGLTISNAQKTQVKRADKEMQNMLMLQNGMLNYLYFNQKLPMLNIITVILKV